MTYEFLPAVLENAQYQLYEDLEFLKEEEPVFKDLCDIAKQYRVIGICQLLLEANPDSFFQNLIYSGRLYLHYLQKSTDAEKITSLGGAVLGSIAAKDFKCAEEIALHSRLAWNEDYEYEDDFLFILFILKLAFCHSDDDELSTILSRYHEVLEGGSDLNYELAVSLLNKDSGAFNTTLTEYLNERELKWKEGLEKGTFNDEQFYSEGMISIKGLALVRIAELSGMQYEDNYPFIPSIITSYSGINYENVNNWSKPFF